MEAVVFDQSYFSARGSYYWNQRENSFQRKSLFFLVDIFLASETILFSIFHRLLPVTLFSPSSGNVILKKSFIPASETDFRANNGLHKKKEKL